MKSLVPRTPPGKPKSSKAVPLKPRYNGPVYLPKPICKMQEGISEPTCPRMAKVHEQDHDEADQPDNPETDLDNHLPDDSYPMQDSDIEDLLETHGHYSAKMAATYHISNHSASSYGSLVDRGANSSLAGADVNVLERTGSKVSVTSIDDHELPVMHSSKPKILITPLVRLSG